MGILSKFRDMGRNRFLVNNSIEEVIDQIGPYCEEEIKSSDVKKAVSDYKKSVKILDAALIKKEENYAECKKTHKKIIKKEDELKRIRKNFKVPLISRIVLNILPFNRQARRYRDIKASIKSLKAEEKMAQDVMRLYKGMVAEQQGQVKSAEEAYKALVDRIISVYNANKTKITLVEKIDSVRKSGKALIDQDLVKCIQEDNLPDGVSIPEITEYIKCIEKGKELPSGNKTNRWVKVTKKTQDRPIEPTRAEQQQPTSQEEGRSTNRTNPVPRVTVDLTEARRNYYNKMNTEEQSEQEEQGMSR